MEKIITQEFSERFGCTPEIIEGIKKCQGILKNPGEWIDQRVAQIQKSGTATAKKQQKDSMRETKKRDKVDGFVGRGDYFQKSVENKPNRVSGRNTKKYASSNKSVSPIDPVLKQALSSEGIEFREVKQVPKKKKIPSLKFYYFLSFLVLVAL